eukprot:scaffold938_cov399-Prasinococcus_capsulatus_cf.AAC.9
MPTARGDLAAVLFGASLVPVVIGGFSHVDWCEPLDTVEAYDAAADAWTTLPSLPTGRADKGAAVFGDRIYTLGGESSPLCEQVGGGAVLVNHVEVYIPADNSDLVRYASSSLSSHPLAPCFWRLSSA